MTAIQLDWRDNRCLGFGFSAPSIRQIGAKHRLPFDADHRDDLPSAVRENGPMRFLTIGNPSPTSVTFIPSGARAAKVL